MKRNALNGGHELFQVPLVVTDTPTARKGVKHNAVLADWQWNLLRSPNISSFSHSKTPVCIMSQIINWASGITVIITQKMANDPDEADYPQL